MRIWPYLKISQKVFYNTLRIQVWPILSSFATRWQLDTCFDEVLCAIRVQVVLSSRVHSKVSSGSIRKINVNVRCLFAAHKNFICTRSNRSIIEDNTTHFTSHPFSLDSSQHLFKVGALSFEKNKQHPDSGVMWSCFCWSWPQLLLSCLDC